MNNKSNVSYVTEQYIMFQDENIQHSKASCNEA